MGPERDTASPRGGTGLNWGVRLASGLLMAALALAAMVEGGAWFAAFIAVVTVAGLREWHRMVTGAGYAIYLAIGAVALVAALAASVAVPSLPTGVPYLVLGAAALVDFALSAVGGGRSLWQAIGPLYLGIPGLALWACGRGRAAAFGLYWCCLPPYGPPIPARWSAAG